MSGHIGLHGVELDAQYVCIHRANLEIKCSENEQTEPKMPLKL